MTSRAQEAPGLLPDDAPAASRAVTGSFRALGRLSGLLIYLVAIVVALDVAARSLEVPLRWPFEVYPYLTYWSALLGVGYVAFLGGNVRMDLLVEENWLGPFKRPQPLFTALVSFLYLVYMVGAGTWLVSNLVDTGRVTYELRVPLFYHAIAMPLGFGLAAAALLIRARRWRDLKGAP